MVAEKPNRRLMAETGAGKRGTGQPVDPIDIAERDWAADTSEEFALVSALSTRILYVASLVKWSFEGESRQLGVNSGEILVLDALRRLGPPYEASPAQLKNHFLISFAGIGKRINRLEELGHVERSANAADGRSQLIRLTEGGLALLHGHQKDNQPPHIRALTELPAEEQEALSRLLKKVQHGIEDAKGPDK